MKNGIEKIFTVILLIISMLSFLFFAGCAGGSPAEEQPVISEPEEEEITDEEPTDEDKIAGMEITGNINILS
ncbi:MAG: hypothetical protein RBR58_03785, partial [Candidatus Humimicrobiaceae bacterium]|nr:hypothetical protein [Candidatus Humimicrobiaceae bacterium]